MNIFFDVKGQTTYIKSNIEFLFHKNIKLNWNSCYFFQIQKYEDGKI